MTSSSDFSLDRARVEQLHERINSWFEANARDLPWRADDRTDWQVMVSEFMLQQTPVVRVLPVWEAWMDRWPTPADLAAVESGEAVRAWGRLGYPRRALRLHAAAQAIVEKHGGEVPHSYDELLALPGIGTYTAAAISVFAFGQRATVIDTNIRRVFARAVEGKALPHKSLNIAETRLAESLMPADLATSVLWNAATMELGALICTAKSPKCELCPVADLCAWVAAGKPEADYVPTGQAWQGTDRQLRGAMMAVLRAAVTPVPASLLQTGGRVDIAIPQELVPAVKKLAALNSSPEQIERCYAGLLNDGLTREYEGHVSL
ncbi:A/G-specific adenine glycosylase [Rothia sp. ZJ932]|uniref:A/G-specific adenine glycosylase n=1 Tax=Rothia sp. ZJ932 TaxID=2810516 RepID=UPI001967F170|nr:A/G-specific adenine glycosylase [Rothia sp. ZJ932]QRZ61767.1 A/G-specific adenine glycosylase [Rothia sp. ZJ932]